MCYMKQIIRKYHAAFILGLNDRAFRGKLGSILLIFGSSFRGALCGALCFRKLTWSIVFPIQEFCVPINVHLFFKQASFGHNATQHFNVFVQVSLWFSFGFDVKGVQSTLNITSEKHQQLKRATVLQVTIYK